MNVFKFVTSNFAQQVIKKEFGKGAGTMNIPNQLHTSSGFRSCTGSTNTAYPGNNIITFNTLNEGTYSDCSLTVTDAASNVSSSLSVGTFKVDTTTPTVSEVTAVPTPTMDTTPSYTFNVSEAATISYGGSCSSSTTSASSGNNAISFNTLSEGAYSNCTITVTDAAGNTSSSLSVNSFTVRGFNS